MKDIIKYAALVAVGLLAAVVVYPVLHEGGHYVGAIAVGARVIEFGLFPLPYVMCELSAANEAGVAVIGLAGMFLPLLLTLVYTPASFWLWYGVLVTKGICLLSFVISAVSVILYSSGMAAEREDIVQVADILGGNVTLLVLLMVWAIIVTIRSITVQKPLSRIFSYFKVT